MWLRLIIRILPGILVVVPLLPVHRLKLGTEEEPSVALCPDDTSEVILIEGNVLLNHKNYTVFMVLQFPAAGMAYNCKHGEVRGYISQ